MSGLAPPPLIHSINLGRLGNAGDTVSFVADPAQLEAIALWSGVMAVPGFSVQADLVRLGQTRFRVEYRLTVDVIQACVVTLEPVPARLERHFIRELHFTGGVHHVSHEPAVVHDPLGEDEPEEIDSLHYDLAGPALEEYVLALDPYPRRPGVMFTAVDEGDSPPENPFTALKALKKGG